MAKADLTAQRLREILDYNPQSDTWTRIAAHKMRPDRHGTQPGNIDNGYLLIRIDGSKYKAHRLV